MLAAFQTFIEEQKLFDQSQKILLAVSGGIDSVVMAHLFCLGKCDFAIAHCNFSLRGNESDQDALLVENIAKSYKVAFHGTRFDTNAEANRRKVSIQMAARELRYEWFSSLIQLHHYNYLATAHHANDVVETVLINLVRGTGIAGLHGILPRNGVVIRPLLFATRDEIEAFASEQKLAWREDSSNNTDKYARNLIRHKVVPVLKLLNSNLEQTMLRNTAKFKQTEEAFLYALSKERKEFEAKTDATITIAIHKILDLPPAYLYATLVQFGFQNAQIDAIVQIISLDFQPGKRFLSEKFILVVDRKYLVITPNEATEQVCQLINDGLQVVKIGSEIIAIAKLPVENYTFARTAEVAELDFDKLQFPLTIRTWQSGDSFIPFGMKGKKKISDLLVESKIPLNLKPQVKVLVSNNEIAWVVGMRISDRFSVDSSTKDILRLEIKP